MQFLLCASAVPSAEQTQPLPVLMLFLFQWEVAQQVQTEIVWLVLLRSPHLGGWSPEGSVAGTAIPHSAALSTASTFSCLLLTWLQEFPDDFCEPTDFSSLKELVSFTQVVLPGSALERQPQVLLCWLESSVASETQTQGLVPSMAAEIVSAADLKTPVAAPAMPPADVEPPWPPELLPPTPATEREAAPRPPALPPSEAASSPDQELKLETSPALPAEQVVALMPPQLPPSGPKPVAPLDLAPAASPPEAPTEQQEADQVPPAMPSVELQSAPAVTPPGDHSCSSHGHQEKGLREVKALVLAFPPRLLAEQLTQIDVVSIWAP
ncbi:uncharacterized protein LOC143666519 [Tamandua tetradactyla]|uniref:uncharacterized protein LOC143666519 n=1 Tax=Tamandua tetradactyla TaxID=48850 RepID=UPI004053FA8D